MQTLSPLFQDIIRLSPKQTDAWTCTDYDAREVFRAKYGYAVPSPKAILAIKNFVGSDSILEINAGRGTWARLLIDEGVSVDATDLFAPIDSKYPPFRESNETFTPIRIAHATIAALETNANCLMTIWPCYDTPMADDALKVFRGNKLVYVGEDSDGCTGDRGFHERIAKDWLYYGEMGIPKWSGLHDRLYLYTRKGVDIGD